MFTSIVAVRSMVVGQTHPATRLSCASRFRTLLTCLARCFGDKGDVEDITEGRKPFQNTKLLRSYQDPTDLTSSADIISTVEFDHTGNYLATGDKGGRVVLFERNETVSI